MPSISPLEVMAIREQGEMPAIHRDTVRRHDVSVYVCMYVCMMNLYSIINHMFECASLQYVRIHES